MKPRTPSFYFDACFCERSRDRDFEGAFHLFSQICSPHQEEQHSFFMFFISFVFFCVFWWITLLFFDIHFMIRWRPLINEGSESRTIKRKLKNTKKLKKTNENELELKVRTVVKISFKSITAYVYQPKRQIKHKNITIFVVFSLLFCTSCSKIRNILYLISIPIFAYLSFRSQSRWCEIFCFWKLPSFLLVCSTARSLPLFCCVAFYFYPILIF